MIFNAYVDGFNLYKGALESRPHLKRLNLPEFCQSRRPDMELGSVYDFTARIKRRFVADLAPERQNAYLRVLANQGVRVVEGQFRKDENWLRLVKAERAAVIQPPLASVFGFTQRLIDSSFKRANSDLPKSFVWAYGEKGSDVNLASHLLRDAFLNSLEAALVISGDSDLATPIRMSREHGVNVKVVVPNKNVASAALKRASTYIEELHISDLGDFQLPRSFITQKGGNIVRPESWR